MQVSRIYCGLDTNGLNVNARELAHNLAAKYFPAGHTIVEANGRWTGEVGVINEPTLIVEVLFSEIDCPHNSPHNTVKSFVRDYKEQANQESVLVLIGLSMFAFIFSLFTTTYSLRLYVE